MVASPPYSRSGNSVLRHHAHAWWPHHLTPVRGIQYFGTMLTHGGLTTLFLSRIQYFGTMLTHGGLTTLFLSRIQYFGTSLRMVSSPPYSRSGNSVLRHHAHAWWPHHLIPVQNSVLRHHAHAWWPHHLIPVYPPPVRGGEYFANNLHCWAHLNQALPQCGARRFGLTPPNSCTSLYRSHENNGHSVKK